MDETLDPATRPSQLFAELMALDVDQRHGALDAATADDAELRREILEMLARAEPEPREPARSLAPRPGLVAEGTVLAGRYRLVRPIGRGGISVVYLADELDGLRRQVALKLLAPGLEAAGLARFEGEKNALARMSHPHVARILDAGFTESGQAYVAMEHIDGQSLDVYCRQHDLGLDGRLSLFVKVCHAVAHAHQKGIIHRDLKPTNVLVTTHDEGPHPKVIDFGIAKSTRGTLLGGDNATRFGFAVGTPGYMSPEQCAADGRDVDTTTDVYALGVILYELLTGSLPHVPPSPQRFDPPSFSQRLMTARLEPMSARLHSLLASGPPSADSRIPHIAPQRLVGDLDIIAAKALSPNPEDRYPTVSELAADIERHLRGEPILARPPSLGYLVSRLLRRRKKVVIASALGLTFAVALALVVGSLVSSEREATEQAQLANERATAEEKLARERTEMAVKARARGAVASAQAAVQAGNAAAAHRSLQTVPPDLRHWEWRWLAHATDQSDVAIDAHQGGVRELALSSDERILASLGEDGEIALWDADDGRPLDRLDGLGPGRFIRYGLAFSVELGVVISSNHDTLCCAHDLVTHRTLWCREGRWQLQAESLAADGRLALSSGPHVVIVDAVTGHELTRFISASGADRAVWADPLLGDWVVAHGAGRLFAYDLSTAPTPRILWWRHGALDTLDHARRVIIAQRGSLFWRREVVSIATGEVVGAVVGEPPSMPGSAIGPDGDFFGAERGSLTVLRASIHDAPRHGLLGHRAPIRIARPTVDGFWVGDAAGSIRRWPKTRPPLPAVTVTASNDAVFGVAFSPRRELLLTSGWGMVKAWNIETGAEVWSHWVGREYQFALDVRGDQVVTGSVAGELTRLSLDGEVRPLAATGLSLSSLTLLDDGIALGTFDGLVIKTDPAGREVRWRRHTHGAVIGQLALSPDGRTLAVIADRNERIDRYNGVYDEARDPAVVLLDAETGVERGRLLVPGADSWIALAWSPDGALLAGGGYQGRLVIWDDRGEVLASVPSMGLEVRALAWSPDGARLFSADENGTVQLWTRAGDHILTLPTRTAHIRGLFMVPRSEALVAVNDVDPLVVYDPRGPIEEARAARLAWSRHEALRIRVDALFSRAATPEDVARLITADPTFTSVREEALAIVRARGLNPNRVNSEVWAVVRYPGEEAGTVALARGRVEHYADRWPRWEFENTRAFARLRDGDLVGAAAAAHASIALGEQRAVEGFPSERAILSLVMTRQGRLEDARTLLYQAELDLEQPTWRDDSEARSIVDEARRALKR